ncbi:hypothetical protein P3T76_009993 [Phytophthora citrophthora]|uniref:Uncharacterized protein n=1 Tax=Phytophthora citrophthora TaxID=4793 RepID=A0AAD9GDM3_9STRA|nr:hypothetical protein P3T76_009993 [Phytophthora citrophthora]
MAMTPAHALQLDAAPEASDFFFGNVLGQGSYAKVDWKLRKQSFTAQNTENWMRDCYCYCL